MKREFKKYQLNEHITMQVLSYTEQMMMAKFWFTGPGFPGTHNHSNEETDTVVAGRFEATNGVEVFPVEVGEGIQVAPSVEHNMKCLTPTGEMVTVWTPARQDLIDKFTELA